MKFDGYHFLMAGAVLAAGATMLLAKAYLFPSFPVEAATTFLGANPFVVRNAIIQRHEAIAGSIWLIGSLVSILLGTAQAAEGGKIEYLIGQWTDILILVFGGAVLWLATIEITRRLGRRAYLPRMIEMQQNLFERDSFAVSHGGLYRAEVEIPGAAQPSADTRQQRLIDARGNLDQIGKLIDVPRGAGETDLQYAERLRPYFQP